MALPLDPDTGMFPDTLVEPFIDAPELAQMAGEVIRQFDEFRPIADAIDEGLRIAYVWETKPFDPGKDEYKVHIVAKVTKASPMWRHVGQTELVIQFRSWFWDKFDDAQRRAVVHHELTHILVDEGLKIGLREHDVEDFWQTMRRFGPVKPGAAGFVKAYLDWQHEQDRPAPTPLRLAHDLVDAVVADPDVRARDHAIDEAAMLNCTMRAPEVRGLAVVRGRCWRCAAELVGRRTRWCSEACSDFWWANHGWTQAGWLARLRARLPLASAVADIDLGAIKSLVRDLRNLPERCERCHRAGPVEINHVVPRVGAGYGNGCHHHQTNLEPLCHACHVAETTAQVRARSFGPQAAPVRAAREAEPLNLWTPA